VQAKIDPEAFDFPIFAVTNSASQHYLLLTVRERARERNISTS
jgi:hypothetical protein